MAKTAANRFMPGILDRVVVDAILEDDKDHHRRRVNAPRASVYDGRLTRTPLADTLIECWSFARPRSSRERSRLCSAIRSSDEESSVRRPCRKYQAGRRNSSRRSQAVANLCVSAGGYSRYPGQASQIPIRVRSNDRSERIYPPKLGAG